MLVTIENVSKIYDTSQKRVEALNDISLSIHEKEFVCIVGPSGCGKSTILKMIAGIDHATNGIIRFEGEKVNGPSVDKGFIFQDYALFPWLTVRKNILFGLEMANTPSALKRERLEEYLYLLDLEKAADLYPSQLSGGMKQRVAIARALCLKPKLLLMDEPFAALDPFLRQKLQEELLRIWKAENITFVLVTHDIEEAIYLADRIIVLTSSPGKVNDVISISMPRPRLRTEEHFIQTRNKIVDLITPLSVFQTSYI
ncbi:ABC transporter ATP-binding protein [Metabacillus fastidiosus]|uniref:ABC transporter ATP-binding protein n=1 Tax=Metabacillus fastidiosus TaxID=1458 RepID=UPI002DB9CA7D|nr:ABC transporter ATP-binding protein [Metabacillus fastidiosus]MEC2077393.1 ABC transporter ATP-binding protein [Metabacillus fastidiosus]